MEEFRLGSCTLKPHRQLLADGERVELGKRALDILSVLAEAHGEIVTKDELLEAVWPNVTVEENALQVHIVALRKALGGEAERLKTIRGVGYQLRIDRVPVQAPQVDCGDLRPAGASASSSESGFFRSSGAAANPRMGQRNPRFPVWQVTLAAFLLFAAGFWALFGDELGLRAEERIPIVLRTFKAEGASNSTSASLARGISEELLVRLRRVPELRVASANADGSVPSDSFASAHIVDGRVRSSGDNLRVTAQLLEVSVQCEPLSGWHSTPLPRPASGHKGLPLGQGGRAASFVGLSVDQVAF